MPQTIEIHGFRELSRAFAIADKTLQRELRVKLREVAEPIRADAERLALSGIPHIGIPWSQMRVGVTQTAVYVAPQQRSKKARANARLRRPNFFDLMMGRSLEPALAANVGLVEAAVGSVLDSVGRAWEQT